MSGWYRLTRVVWDISAVKRLCCSSTHTHTHREICQYLISSHYKFTAESDAERVLKIDQHLAKLHTKVQCIGFLTHSVQCKTEIMTLRDAKTCITENGSKSRTQ